MKDIRLVKGSSPTKPWEVHCNAGVFGKRIRKRFKLKAKAKHHIQTLENRLLNKERTPLDPELHKLVALYAPQLTISQIATMLEEAYKKAGYRIPKNGLRHSFGSHHLVHYQNADNTANEMGHVGPTMTFKAYRKAVLKSQAANYFAIRCSAKPWVIIKGMGIKKPQKLAEQIAA